jgi:deferrochelatase/peroxidase EfeB
VVGNTQWCAGPVNKYGVRNYEVLAQALMSASPDALEAFVRAIRDDDKGLMDAHAEAFYAGNLDRSLADTHLSWFGVSPMWFWDCTSTPDEIHQVMRESRARTCELLLAGATGVKLFKQCGHPRFHTIITWEGARPEDADAVQPNASGLSGQRWSPAPVAGCEVHVWVYTPYDAGYADENELQQPEFVGRRTAAAQLLASLKSMPMSDIQDLMTTQDLDTLLMYSPQEKIFLNGLTVGPGNGVLPAVSGLQVRFLDNFAEPPQSGELVRPMIVEPKPAVPRVIRQGIDISWGHAGEGRFERPLPDGTGAGAAPAPVAKTSSAPAPQTSAEPVPVAPTSVQPVQQTVQIADDRPVDLGSVQANILQPHVRNSCAVLLLEFPDAASGNGFLPELGSMVKSAFAHATDTARYRQRPVQAGAGPGATIDPYIGVGLSHAGYERLGVPPEQRPSSPAFRAGMGNRPLGDPPSGAWEGHLRPAIHAIVIVGSPKQRRTELTVDVVRTIAAAHGVVIREVVEWGTALQNSNRDPIEHFGYVDGRSQPLFLDDDIRREQDASGTSVWDPSEKLEEILVADPASDGHGSYLIFRKLEQHVQQFRTDITTFATEVGLPAASARAGALLVGRFEDGTPSVLQYASGMHSPVTNNFTYDDDPDGLKCPLNSHMRIMNDRTNDGTGKRPVIARRGIPYGVRDDDPNDGDLSTKPTGGVGLLFMAFVDDIETTFEALQAKANDPDNFDPIIGQPAQRARAQWPGGWRDDGTISATGKVEVAAIGQSVEMRGGEYFFMPSLPFLRAIRPS